MTFQQPQPSENLFCSLTLNLIFLARIRQTGGPLRWNDGAVSNVKLRISAIRQTLRYSVTPSLETEMFADKSTTRSRLSALAARACTAGASYAGEPSCVCGACVWQFLLS